MVAAAAVSWAEFNQLQDKVSRYNHTIITINELVVWWASLNEVDQPGSANLDRLIIEGERAINAELTTWRAAVSAAASKTAATATEEEPQEGTAAWGSAKSKGAVAADTLRQRKKAVKT